MKTLIKILVLMLLVVNATMALGSKYPYPDVADRLVKDVISVLVDHGLCADVHECRRKEFAFRGGTPEHAVISIFNIGKMSDLIIRDITVLCIDAYYNEDMKIQIELKAYVEEREEAVKWFSSGKPAVHLMLRGEK